MGFTSDTKFLYGRETCAFLRTNKIMFDDRFLKDGKAGALFLKAFIHEINEIEVSKLLISHGFSDLVALSLGREAIELLESNNIIDFSYQLVSHLLSPYGYKCLIGIKENALEW